MSKERQNIGILLWSTISISWINN